MTLLLYFQVCEVYRLHRESFYLATDFLDRYLSKQSNIQKHQLQLIGITCLFIAAKLEVRLFFLITPHLVLLLNEVQSDL